MRFLALECRCDSRFALLVTLAAVLGVFLARRGARRLTDELEALATRQGRRSQREPAIAEVRAIAESASAGAPPA